MVSFSNGCVSGDASNKRPLENGCVPKYKPRKVSAVRDFPPRCGRNAVLTNKNLEENGANASRIRESPGLKNSETFGAEMANGAEISVVVGILDPMAVESLGVSKKIGPDGCKTAETPEAVQHDEITNSDMAGTPGVENSNAGVLCQSDAGKDSGYVNMTEQRDASGEDRPLEIQLPNNNMVNNPLELEEVEPLDALEGRVTTTAAVDGSLDVEKLMTEAAFIDAEKLDEIKNDPSKDPLLGNSQVVASSPDRILPKTSIRPKDKYRKRSVSAVRDFPPHCGRNCPLPVVREMSMANEKFDVDLEGTTSRHVAPGGSAEQMMTSQKKHLDEADNIHAETETTETLNDGGKGPLGEIMGDIEQGVSMDPEDCNRKAEPRSTTMPDAVTNTGFEGTEKLLVRRETVECSPNRDDNEWTPQSGFRMGNESCREIVHGLAAPNAHCPSRKGKMALNGPENGSRGVNVRKQNLSRREKPKAADLNSNLKENCSGGPSVVNDILTDSCHPDGSPGSHVSMTEEDNDAYDECAPLITPISMAPPVIDSDDDCTGKEIVVYSPGQSDELGNPRPVSSPADEEVDREIVHGLMAAPDRPSRKRKTVSSKPDGQVTGEKGTQKLSWRQKAKAVARKSTPKAKFPGLQSKKSSGIYISDDEDESPSVLVPAGNEADNHGGSFLTKSLTRRKMMSIEISLPPFGPKGSGNGDARNRVRETLRTFNALCRKLLQQDESNTLQEDGKSTGKKLRRIDLLSAKAIKEMGKEVNTDKMYLGSVPGVEVGDEFQYRVELAVVGIHRLYQAGIDSIKIDGMLVATSIVSSGAYCDDVENADVLIYSGQGGNVVGKTKEPEDQKLEKGNLALYNSISKKTPVRVIRGWKEPRVMDPLDPKPKMVTIYVYDGLYTVTTHWPQKGPHGKQVFMFELKRNPGQPELAWKELKKTNKFKVRPGMVVSDISGGKEPLAICAVNTSDEQKPPLFNYISKMMYPEWFKPKSPAGCDCTGRCSDSRRCRCAVRNGGEIPYNRNGAIVETKPLVYECGPHCRCPPSCYNRVTQRGIKFQLEIFNTGSRGWGVRALTSIPSGSFICEYAGELLEDKEAEERVGNDEYLFDIGQNYSDASVMAGNKTPIAELEEGGYTIDAAQYGNVGRFINHSCSPNLYAQNVIYDHDDKRMPHVMLFAMENIPPLQELTYHYNYSVDQIRDSNGNIKVKECYCGSSKCTGRMY